MPIVSAWLVCSDAVFSIGVQVLQLRLYGATPPISTSLFPPTHMLSMLVEISTPKNRTVDWSHAPLSTIKPNDITRLPKRLIIIIVVTGLLNFDNVFFIIPSITLHYKNYNIILMLLLIL